MSESLGKDDGGKKPAGVKKSPAKGKRQGPSSVGAKQDIDDNDDDVIVENDIEEAGYRSDRSASDEGSTDAVVDRRRDKGSSGYEESGEEEEGVSEISEGHRERVEQEEDEYDEEATADASSGDEISEDVNEDGSEGYEEDTEEEESNRDGKDDGDDEGLSDDEVEDVKSPSFVPKRTGFWGHDDRHDRIKVEESRAPRGGKTRQLWDRASDRWEHDLYKEEEQGPKEPWEIEETMQELERGPPRGRNRQRLGDFVSNRGRRGRGRSTRERREEEREREQQEDSSEFEEKRPENRPRGRGRGRAGNLRGRPRGRGGYKGERRHDWNKENEGEQGRGNGKRELKEYNWQADESTAAEEQENRTERIVNKENEVAKERPSQKEDDDKPNEGRKEPVKEKTTSQSDKQSPKKDVKEETRVPKGRGKGVISQKVTSSKKTATEFNKEKKKQPKEKTVDEDRFEDSPATKDGTVVEESGTKKGQTSAKPKRYSSQRQRANVADEQQFQNQSNDSATIPEGQYYGQFPQQDVQSGMFNHNQMEFLQYQMQQIQLQMQALQSQPYGGTMGAHQQQQQQQQSQPPPQSQTQQPAQQQQIPVQQGQAPQIMTPAMQQYMQQQFLLQLQALQRAQMPQQQQHQGQQQQQLQQQQLQDMRVRQQMSKENGQGSPDQTMVIQGNTFPTMPTNMRTYAVAHQAPPGIYTQSGSQYEVPYEQIMSSRAAPQQQAGLFIPQMHQLPQQQMQIPDAQRKARSAAIPIKPPPDQQES